MIKVIKQKGKLISAFRLENGSKVIEDMITQGKIKKLSDGSFEVFSQEAVNGSGEVAFEGDYIKVDSSGFPYPNNAEYFEVNHKWIEGNQYEQIPMPLDAWIVQEPMCDEIEFLIKEKGLEFNENNPERYFNAPLWGTKLSAAKDAVIVFYSISKDATGRISDADFNFVSREEFDKTYFIVK